ncbi:MAG: class I SAM-dependent methyltransferase [Pseudomonadota bacterium]
MTSTTQAHWQTVHTTRASDAVSWFQGEPAPSLALIAAAGVGAGASVVDVGGGASSLVDRLQWAGFRRLSVLDISSGALDVARARLGAEAQAIDWIVSDVTAWSPAVNAYDLWHDRAVFHFLVTEPERQAYLGALNAGLRGGGYLILATFAPTGPEQCSGLPVRRYSADDLCVILGPEFQRIESKAETHLTPGGGRQDFTWGLFRKRVIDPGQLGGANET